jgi:hypothetical protein
MKDDRIAEFKKYMAEEFAKIPQNLTIEEFLDRSERCMSLSENFRQERDMFKAKKYELLSRKYKQLAEYKKNPALKPQAPGQPVQQIIDEVPKEETPVVKKSFFKKISSWFKGEESSQKNTA